MCCTYWMFNQLLACTSRKDAPLTHGHLITIVAKALNVNLDNYTHFVEHSYFTKQAFVRGEIVDDAFFLFLPIPILVGEVFKDHHWMRSNNMKNPKRRVIRRSFPNIHCSVMFLSLLIRFKVPLVCPQVHILLFGIKFWIHRLLCSVNSMK